MLRDYRDKSDLVNRRHTSIYGEIKRGNRRRKEELFYSLRFAQAVTVMVLIAAPAPPQIVAKITLGSTISIGHTCLRYWPTAGAAR
jgi:hypothetical protein